MTSSNNSSNFFDQKIALKFVKGLLKWNAIDNKRQMPWKGQKDAYKIWLSEIILQQTRVEQGLGYYQRFIKAYPHINDLAAAPEQDVLKLWEGLGYYSRCKNLIHSARHIHNELNGVFPKEYHQILSLKGVGSYTAAAIASFAYNLPYAVVDGNVFRVLSRIFDIETPIDITEGKKIFSSVAESILPAKRAGEYNQAIMDFGATVCKPIPICASCFFKDKCPAFLQGKQQQLPVKIKKTKVKERWFTYIVVQNKTRYAIKKRVAKDIWPNLFEFLLIETSKAVSLKKKLLLFEKAYGKDTNNYCVKDEIINYKQRISHQIIHFQFIKIVTSHDRILSASVTWVEASQLKKYPFPKTIHQYIQQHV